MLKKTIKYVNYNGEEKEVKAYFNFTATELIDRFGDAELDPKTAVKTMKDNIDAKELSKTLENIILDAYGVVSPDGDEFVKTQQVKDDFKRTAAFETLKWELIQDPNAALDFLISTFPSNLQKEINTEEIKAEAQKLVNEDN